MSDIKPVKLQAEINWAFFDKVSDMSGKYQVDLAQLSSAAVEALEMMGLSIRNKEGQGDFVTVKSNHPIRVYDTDGKEITGILIGNGSKAKAVLSYYDWKSPAGQAGRSPKLFKLVVTDLIPYGGKEEFVEVDMEEAL